MGALLHNPSPGEHFTGGDLVRNLVLAAVANKDLETQEQFYFQYWLRPIEEKVSGTVTDFVNKFVQKFDIKHECKTETFAKQYLKDKPKEKANIMSYARFYSLYEWRLQKANDSTSLENIDPEFVIQETKNILKEMAKDLISMSDSENPDVFKRPKNPPK